MLIPYTRVSPEHQERERESCAIQAQRLAAYGQAHGLQMTDEVRDEDRSGKDLKRPGWLRVIERLEAGEASGVVVVKLDRLTRSLRDLLEVMELFSRRGWELHAVADRVDTSSATGRLIVHILGSLAQWERETIGERTSAALQHKKAQGCHIGGVPYGWRRAVGADGKMTALEPVPEEQQTIALVRNWSETWTQDRVADELNLLGVPTRSGRPWSRRGVQCILSQPSTDGSMDTAPMARRREMSKKISAMTDSEVLDELHSAERYVSQLKRGAVPVGDAAGLNEAQSELDQLAREFERRYARSQGY